MIMRRVLRRAGVRLFRPDLAAPISSPSNRFLWELAFQYALSSAKINSSAKTCLPLRPDPSCVPARNVWPTKALTRQPEFYVPGSR